jgi:hypothetical protein
MEALLGRTASERRTVAGHPPPSMANCPECPPNQQVHRRSRIARCTVTVHPPSRCVRRLGSRVVKNQRVTSLSASAWSGDLLAYGLRGEALVIRALKHSRKGRNNVSQDPGRCSSPRVVPALPSEESGTIWARFRAPGDRHSRWRGAGTSPSPDRGQRGRHLHVPR